MTSQADQLEMAEAVLAIRRGNLVVYPTETLYALGAAILCPAAVEQVFRLKGRPQDKPLPVLIGALDQLPLITDHPDARLARLTGRFWPGPLSVLVPARPGLSRLLQDRHGFTAVRWSSHPVAQTLALRSGSPLTATSANISGRPAAARIEDLDPELIAAPIPGKLALQQTDPAPRACRVLVQPPHPAGGLPSTLVRIQPDGRLDILRAGVVGPDQLRQAGWRIG